MICLADGMGPVNRSDTPVFIQSPGSKVRQLLLVMNRLYDVPKAGTGGKSHGIITLRAKSAGD